MEWNVGFLPTLSFELKTIQLGSSHKDRLLKSCRSCGSNTANIGNFILLQIWEKRMLCVNSSSGWNCIYFGQIPFYEKKILWTSVEFSISIFFPNSFLKIVNYYFKKGIRFYFVYSVFFLKLYLCTICIPGSWEGQKRISDPQELEVFPWGCWEWKQGPLKEQPVSLAEAEPPVQTQHCDFYVILFYMLPLQNDPNSLNFVLFHSWPHILGLLFWSSLMVTKIKTEALGKPGGYSTTEP